MSFANTPLKPFGMPVTGHFGYWKQDVSGSPAGVKDGLQLWFKVDDTSKVNVSAGKITSWQSSGGQSVTLTSSVGQELSYVSGAINGLPIARGLGSQAMSATISAFTPKQFFIVAKHNTTGNFQWVFGFGSTQNDTSFLSSSVATEAFKLETNNGAQQTFQSTIAFNQGEFNILGGEINSTNSQLQFNTETVASGTLANVSSTKFNLLQSFDGGGKGEYDIAEVIVYDRVLTTSEQKAVEGYLLNKYFATALYDNNNNVLLDNNYNILTSEVIPAPLQIGGTSLWLDASDTTTINYSSGSSVLSWFDKSGNNRHVSQSSTSAQPTWNSSTGLTFDGVDDAMYGDGIPGTDYSFFIVYRLFGTGGTRAMFSNGDATAGVSCRMTTTRNIVHNNVAVVAGLGAFSTDGTYEIMGGRRNASSAFSHVNGGNFGTYSGGISGVVAPFTNKLGIGNRPTTNEFVKVAIKEIVYYNRQITAEEANLIQLYLSSKWNINILGMNTLLNNTSWYVRGANTQSNGAVADPDGGNLAYSFTSLAAGNSYLYQSVPLVPGVRYRLSQQVKSSSSTPFFFYYSEWNGSTYNIQTSTPVTTSNTWQTVTWEFTANTPTINFNQIHIIPPDRPNGSQFTVYKPVLTRLT